MLCVLDFQHQVRAYNDMENVPFMWKPMADDVSRINYLNRMETLSRRLLGESSTDSIEFRILFIFSPKFRSRI